MRATVLSVVVVNLVTCSLAGGQQIPFNDMSAGMSFGYVWTPARMFSGAICPDEHPSVYRLHGTLRLTDLFFLSVGGSLNTENPDQCVDGLVPPIPDEGPYTARWPIVDPSINDYPFTAVGFLVGVHAESESGDVRAGFGPVWFPSKDLMGTKAALEAAVRIRDLPFSILIGLDQTWLDLSYTEGEFHYQDGQLVDCLLTPSRSREQLRVLRLGVEVSASR